VSLAATIKAMAAAGCTAEQMAKVADDYARAEEEKAALRREGAARRQREFKARQAAKKAAANNADNALPSLSAVTEREQALPALPDAGAYKDNRAGAPVFSNDLPTEDISYTPTPSECPQGGCEDDRRVADRAEKKTRSERGTRISNDWSPSEAEIEICVAIGYDREFILGEALESFRGYWLALPGAKAKKLDWGQTFCNRMREHPQRRFLTAKSQARAGPPRKRLHPTERLALGITNDAEEDAYFRSFETPEPQHERSDTIAHDGPTIDLDAADFGEPGAFDQDFRAEKPHRGNQPHETADLWGPRANRGGAR
jgi:hypothetical protein